MDNKVILVDGTSHIFRAYHRMGLHLTSPSGQNVGALYTFCLMLKKMLKNYPKTSIVMFFDQGGKNFRHELYSEYKANREKPDDELIAQIDLCHKVAQYYGFPVVKRSGVEADDLIGTVARQYSKNYQVEIHSPDKDFMQLVGPNIKVVVDEKTSYKHYDEQAVFEKYQIKASSFRDFLALKGDASDNIPGLKGCGDKTAAKWLNEYGTIENLIENQDKISGKIGQKLREGTQIIQLSQKLVTISVNQHWPEEIEKESLPSPPFPNQQELEKMFTQLDFKSLLPSVSVDKEVLKKQIRFFLVDDMVSARSLLEKLSQADKVAFDLETSSLDPYTGKIIGLSFCFDFNQAYYLHLDSFSEEENQELITSFSRLFSKGTWIAHNFKFDAKYLKHHWKVTPGTFEDTMIMAYLLQATGPFDLKTLAQKELSWSLVSFEDLLKRYGVKVFSDLSKDEQCDYACLDAASTYRLYEHYLTLLQDEPSLLSLYEQLEKPFIKTLINMELRGILLDKEYLKSLKDIFLEERQSYQEKIHQLAGKNFNVASTKQLREVLFEHLELPVRVKTPKGLPSTNEAALAELSGDFEICDYLMKWREVDKLISTYTDSLIEQVDPMTGAVHTLYHQTGTVTGRLSSSNPNLQNIPIKTEKGRMIRKAFIAREGYVLLAADYSQIELRLMAHFSQDLSLLEAYSKGDDIHSLTASKIYECSQDQVSSNQRRDAKVVNFGLIYGMSPWGLSKQLKVNMDTAQQFHQRFFDKYPKVKEYMDSMQSCAAKDGHVRTLLGRKIPIREGASSSNANFRAAINGPLQGTASDLIKTAMVNLEKAFANDDKVHLLMQVHDELVFEVEENSVERVTQSLLQHMQQALEISVPLEVNIDSGQNWEEAHA